MYTNGPLWLTKGDDGGKVSGIFAVNTPCTYNEFCLMMQQIVGSVCEECFGKTQLAYKQTLEDHLIENWEILTKEILPLDELPIFPLQYGRIEMVGELGNMIHAINYYNIVRENPRTNFAWWSKRLDIMDELFSTREKPINLRFIASSPMLNTPINVGDRKYVDHVFTVYTFDYAVEHNIHINCGSRKCVMASKRNPACKNCYENNGHNEFYVNEILKCQRKKWEKYVKGKEMA